MGIAGVGSHMKAGFQKMKHKRVLDLWFTLKKFKKINATKEQRNHDTQP